MHKFQSIVFNHYIDFSVDYIDTKISLYMLMIDILYIESDLEMEDVHAEDAMRETGEGQKVQNVEHQKEHNIERQKAYQGRKSNEMTLEEGEE